MPHMYLNTGHTAGEECSSTYEGRHLTIEESLITHPYHSDGFVDGGDPVVVGGTDGVIVGVAFSSATAATDFVAIDTEGIWFLDVYALDDGGASAIDEGDLIFINTSTCVLSKVQNETTQQPFGYSLGEVAAGHDVLAVKVHFDPLYWDFYRSLSGATADDAFSFNITDTGTSASGYSRGIYVNYVDDGVKTGTSEVNVIGADMTIQHNLPYAYGISLYAATSGNPTLGLMSAISIYMDDPGTACANLTAIDIGLAGGANSPSGRHAFMRMRNHSAGATPDCAFQFEGTGNADYFASWETVSVPVIAAAIGGGQTHKIRVRVQGVDYFIPLHTA